MSALDRRRTQRNLTLFGLTLAASGVLLLNPHPRQGVSHTFVASSAAGAVPQSGRVGATFVGASIHTRYGPVQVEITVVSGQIVAARAVTYPTGERLDREINSYAVPILQAQTLRTQGFQVDTISGATFTSEAYRASLQSALDQANLR